MSSIKPGPVTQVLFPRANQPVNQRGTFPIRGTGIQDDFLCRVGANGDKDPKKVKFYYKKLRADFDSAIDGVFEDLAALNG